MILHFSHMGFTDGLTFICFNLLFALRPGCPGTVPVREIPAAHYLLLQVIRPRVRS